MSKVFIAGGVSYNQVVQLSTFPTPKPQTILDCHFHEGIGSTGTGKAMNLCQLEMDTTLYTRIGTDELALKIRQELEKMNVHLIFEEIEGHSERHLNVLNEQGQRISIFTHRLTEAPIQSLNNITAQMKKAKYVVINIDSYCIPLLEEAKKLKQKVWTDLHDVTEMNSYYDPFIEACDYFFFSDENLKQPRRFMETLISKGKKLVVCTKGKDGAMALDDSGQFVDVPIQSKYSYVNSNGAGDAFFSGFLRAFDEGLGLNECMELATHVAGLCITSENLYCSDMKWQSLICYRNHC